MTSTAMSRLTRRGFLKFLGIVPAAALIPKVLMPPEPTPEEVVCEWAHESFQFSDDLSSQYMPPLPDFDPTIEREAPALCPIGHVLEHECDPQCCAWSSSGCIPRS